MTAKQEDQLSDLSGYIRDEAHSLERTLDDRNRDNPNRLSGRLYDLKQEVCCQVAGNETQALRASLVNIAGLCLLWAVLLEETP